ncbi:MAG: flagellar biosynthesis protein FlhF [Burkholderiaceae bacterium]|nr:flagellar biosynthesis protein FlhF [Burkholderiaceae bacterium]
MSIQRFLAPTSREAMAKARGAFGESAVILSSRATAGGFEVVATAEENLSNLALGSVAGSARPVSGAPEPRDARRAQAAAAPPPRPTPRSNTVESDTETMAMSTLSFQDYVRERMLKRRKEALDAQAAAAAPAAPVPTRSLAGGASRTVAHPGLMGVPSVPPAPRERLAVAGEQPFSRHVVNDLTPSHAPRPVVAQPATAAPPPIVTREREQSDWNASMLKTPAPEAAAPMVQPTANIASELSAIKDMIEDRFNMLAWLGTSRQNPLQSNLMLKLIRSGYSPALVRSVLERLPADGGPAEAVRWVMDVLARNLRASQPGVGICDEGGVVSLIGATGVGKTTTAAKLAAQCVKTYGANSVGLITLDTYRVAGYEQLRAYGRMMGVVAHLAHDRAALKDMLNLLSGKRLVVIDTAGLGQKDPRIQEMLDVLDMPGIKKALVLNASSQGDTLDDVLGTFKTKALHGVVLSKVDEAVKLGPALDALIRHQVVLRGVANGQRVPEDWQNPDAAQLVRTSMGSAGKSAYDPAPSELGFFFAQPAQAGMAMGAIRV